MKLTPVEVSLVIEVLKALVNKYVTDESISYSVA